MDKEIFLKYCNPETPEFLNFSQAQALLKDIFGFDPESVQAELPNDLPLSFEFLSFYLKVKNCAGCNFVWPLFFQLLTLKEPHPQDSDRVDAKLEAGEPSKDHLHIGIDLSVGAQKESEEEEEKFIGIKVRFGCENPQATKAKFETVLSNIKTLLKNFAKSIFKIYDLFQIEVVAKEKEIFVKFMLKDPESAKKILNMIEFIQETHFKNNGHTVQGSAKLNFDLSCEGDAKKLIFGNQYISFNFSACFPKPLKTFLNETLFNEAKNLLSQQESFGVKYISRVTFFCLFHQASFALEFKKVQALSQMVFNQAELPLGNMFEEQLIELLSQGPPFVKKFVDAISMLTGKCSFRTILPSKIGHLELTFEIPELFSAHLKDVLGRKLK